MSPLLICGRVSRVLEESVKGVLLVHSGRLASSENETEVPADTWVAIAGVQRSGDGSSQLEFVASWSAAGLESYKPIWPQPPFDFMNKTVRIACIKKPQVFEFEDGASLDSAGGYIVEILKVIPRARHNFTGVLVPTEVLRTARAPSKRIPLQRQAGPDRLCDGLLMAGSGSFDTDFTESRILILRGTPTTAVALGAFQLSDRRRTCVVSSLFLRLPFCTSPPFSHGPSLLFLARICLAAYLSGLWLCHADWLVWESGGKTADIYIY
ncbi:hypothetical protein C7M84_000713 [Penaeus vannamei]|uniref:Uncharacterized protein n=1 Tax=Penaeus vannamei TaxID=6689 RepID=A0A3R7N927_PENVA|nr:hypothetical protein C7M84_000713 [Penaeus vannamei]